MTEHYPANFTPFQISLPCGLHAVVDATAGEHLDTLFRGLENHPKQEEMTKLLCCTVETRGMTVFLTSSHFVQRFRRTLRDYLEPKGLNLAHDRELARRGIFDGGYG